MKSVKGFYLPDDDYYFEDNLDERGFQIDHLDKALEYVKDFSVAIDGGAHIGTWSLQMAKRFKKVLAFEPHPQTYYCLVENTLSHEEKDINNIICHQAALGDEEKTVSIIDDSQRIGNTGSRYITSSMIDPIHVRMTTIDQVCSCEMILPEYSDNFSVGFIKLDIEGYEFFALRGAEITIRKYRPIILIEEKGFQDRFGIQNKAATGYLESLGYHCVAQMGKDFVFTY